jgi:hypothetical protein
MDNNLYKDPAYTQRIILQMTGRCKLSYRGELLGIGAIHTLILAICQHKNLDLVRGKICCDSRSALNKSSKKARRIRPGAAQADLFCALRLIYLTLLTTLFTHEWFKVHMDRRVPWEFLTLEQLLSKTCNKLANCAITSARSREGAEKQMVLPLLYEGAAIITEGLKNTSYVAPMLHHILGWEEARRFYIRARDIKEGVNKGGLGWSQSTFDAVNWKSLASALKYKLEIFSLWLSKQSIGVCATWRNLVRIQDILDDRCPNCGSIHEDNKYLNRCPDLGRRWLF